MKIQGAVCDTAQEGAVVVENVRQSPKLIFEKKDVATVTADKRIHTTNSAESTMDVCHPLCDLTRLVRCLRKPGQRNIECLRNVGGDLADIFHTQFLPQALLNRH